MNTILHDADIRDELCGYLEEKYGKVRFFDELCIGRSRADIVLVTEGGLIGAEIKSDADTYERLARQVKDYDRYFDQNLVVVGSKHAFHIKEHVPDYWGVLTVERAAGRLDFYELREPQANPKAKLSKQLSLLWKRELSVLQEENGLYKYPGKSKDYRQKYILEEVCEEKLKGQVIDILFDRDYSIFED